MNVDECWITGEDYNIVHITVYGFIDIIVKIVYVQYLSLFDEGLCTLLIKDGEILKEKIK